MAADPWLSQGSGVAYINLTRGDAIRSIQRWPGRGDSNQNKVPTSLCYRSDIDPETNSQRPTSWGFVSESCLEQNDNDDIFVDWFKPHLDENHLKSISAKQHDRDRVQIRDIEKYYSDYLRCLYSHIQTKLSGELVDKTWDTAHID